MCPWRAGLTLRLALGHQHQGVRYLAAALSLQVAVDPEFSANFEFKIVPERQIQRNGLSECNVPSIGEFLTSGAIYKNLLVQNFTSIECTKVSLSLKVIKSRGTELKCHYGPKPIYFYLFNKFFYKASKLNASILGFPVVRITGTEGGPR